MFGLKSIVKLIDTIYEHVKKEYYDENKVNQELLQMRLKYEMGEISFEEFTNAEKNLMERIIAIREYKKQLVENDEDELDE